MTILRMQDLDLRGKRVLIREDLNVAVKNGVIANDTRIVAAAPAHPCSAGCRRPRHRHVPSWAS
jgi:3-phosphoglycerate kinase